MELFSINCTTCQKRLKVREESAIGQIVICPSCGSMVLVQAPAAWRSAAGPASAAPPQDAAHRADSQPPEPPPRSDSDPEPPPVSVEAPPVMSSESLSENPDAPPVADVAAPPLGVDGGSEPPQIPAAAAAPAGPAPDTAEATPRAAGSDPDASAEPAQAAGEAAEPLNSRKDWLRLAGAVAAGIMLAFGVFIFLASRVSAPPTKGPLVKAPPESQKPAAAAQTPGGQSPTQPPAETPEAQPAESSQAKPETPDAPANPAPTPAPQPAVKPAAPPTETTPAAEPASEKPTDQKPAEEKPPVTPDAPEAKPDETPAAKPADMAQAPTFDAFAPFLDNNTIAPAAPAAEAPARPPTMLASTNGGARQSAAPRPAPRNVDVPQRLKDSLAAVEFTGTPLIDFLQFVGRFSTVPITVDPEALALLKLTPQTPVTVKQSKTDVEQLLDAALKPLRLGCVALPGQLLVTTRNGGPQGELRKLRHSVADLAGSDPKQVADLAALIVRLVEPESWEARGGPGSVKLDQQALVFEQHDTTLFRALVFCEKLRAARGLPPQSTFNPALFRLESRTTLVQPALGKRLTMNYLQPTLLLRILDQVRKDTGVAVLVDWPAIAELGWSPEAETTIAATDLPLGEALDKLLKPLDLAYRVLDETTLQLTSPTVLAARSEVEFYPLARLLPAGQPDAKGAEQAAASDAAVQQLLTRLRRDLGLTEPADAATASVLHFDPPSKCLIAALSQPQQRRLAELLAQPSAPVADDRPAKKAD